MSRRPPHHPLDDEFEVKDEVFTDEYDDELHIPSDPDERNLDMVIDLALRQYKLNVDDMALIEPKNRLRILEINEKLLAQIKDARYKKERLQIERDKMPKGRSRKASEDEEEGEGEQDEGTLSREQMHSLRRVK